MSPSSRPENLYGSTSRSPTTSRRVWSDQVGDPDGVAGEDGLVDRADACGQRMPVAQDQPYDPVRRAPADVAAQLLEEARVALELQALELVEAAEAPEERDAVVRGE